MVYYHIVNSEEHQWLHSFRLTLFSGYRGRPNMLDRYQLWWMMNLSLLKFCIIPWLHILNLTKHPSISLLDRYIRGRPDLPLTFWCSFLLCKHHEPIQNLQSSWRNSHQPKRYGLQRLDGHTKSKIKYSVWMDTW